jgi:hypothetical protein
LLVPPPPMPPFSGRTYSIFSDFVEEKTQRHTVFAIWDEDSYAERFLAMLPCTCVLQCTLIHLYQTSSLLSGHLPIVASDNLRLLYLLLNREHINHIQVLRFLSVS